VGIKCYIPNRNTGLGGITVEGKQVATEDYVNGKVKTDVPVGANSQTQFIPKYPKVK